MHPNLERILLSEAELQARVADLGAQITRDYAGRDLLVVGILRGSYVFLADLLRQVDLPVQVDFMSVSSYVGTESSGQVRIHLDLSREIKGRDVLLVEDILDTGNTLSQLIPTLLEREPNSLRLCVLLDKEERRLQAVSADYIGFPVPDLFLVGYGLDYEQNYRNLPYVGILKPSVS